MYPVLPGHRYHRLQLQQIAGVFVLSLLVILLIQSSNLFKEKSRAVVAAVQENFLRQETDVSAMLLNRKFFLELVSSVENKELTGNTSLKTLRELSHKSYAIALYKGDSLIYWNKPGLVIEPDYLSRTQFPVFASDHRADYVLKRYQIYNGREKYQAFAKIPVIGDGFRDRNLIVTSLGEARGDDWNIIHTQEGKAVCRIKFQEEMLSLTQQIILLCSYLAGFISLLLIIGVLLEKVFVLGAAWLIPLMILITAGLRVFTLQIPYHDYLNRLSILTPLAPTGTFTYSLGDLFFDALLFASLVLYWYWRWPSARIEELTRRWMRATLSTGYYLIMILAIGLFAYITKYAITESSVPMDLENIAFFSGPHILFFGSTGIMCFGLFLLCNRVVREINIVVPVIYYRLGALILASAISIPVLSLLSLGIPFFGFYLAVFSFLTLMDFYLESRSKSVIWVISWILLIAGFSAALLFNYHLERDATQRSTLAKAIVTSLDESAPVDEQLLSWLPHMPAQYNMGVFKAQQLVYSYNASYPLLLNNDGYSRPEGEPQAGSKQPLRDVEENPAEASHRGFTVLIGKKAENFMSVVSLFSYLFTIFSILLFLMALINSMFPFLPPSIKLSLSPKPSLSNRIQIAIVFLIILSFVIIGFVTVFYLRNNSSDRDKRLFEERLRTIATSLQQAIPEDESLNMRSLVPRLGGIAYAYSRQAKMYDKEGNLLLSSKLENDLQKKTTVKMSFLAKLALDLSSRYFIVEESGSGFPVTPVGYVALRKGNSSLGYIALPLNARSITREDDSAGFIATLLNAYVFLFLIAVALAIAVANSITRPLSELGDKLKKFNIGKKNEELQWDSDDEIGTLISDYNIMIRKLDESMQILTRTERDLAWREMAKQVAHEIKNPLTPMKLSIQYLQNSLRGESGDLKEKADRVSNTLLEQIENLATIASEFSNFATMPQAENEKVILNDVVASVHDLFRKRDDMDISLYVPIQDITVFADRNQVIRVLNNILKNAIQSIPEGVRGAIEINLRKHNDNALIEVKDNGVGIPETMQDKVFTPNFTTKSSGTGLGLAISANIVESFNGRIYFETHAGKGTSFFIEIPMMRSESGQQDHKRVSL